MGVIQREEIMKWFRGWPSAGAEKSGETQDRYFSRSVWYVDDKNNSNSSPIYIQTIYYMTETLPAKK